MEHPLMLKVTDEYSKLDMIPRDKIVSHMVDHVSHEILETLSALDVTFEDVGEDFHEMEKCTIKVFLLTDKEEKSNILHLITEARRAGVRDAIDSMERTLKRPFEAQCGAHWGIRCAIQDAEKFITNQEQSQ